MWVYDVNPGVLPNATITDCTDGWRGRLTRVDTYHYHGGVEELVSRKDYCYDDRGRVLTEHRTVSAGLPYTFSYSYNPNDSIKTATYPNGDLLSYEYDRAGMLSRLTSADVGVIVDGTKWNAAGLWTERTLGPSTIVQSLCYGLGAGAYRLTRAITAAARTVVADQPPVAGGPLHDVEYGFGSSRSDRILSRFEAFQDPNAGWAVRQTSYQYDGRSRLEAEIYDGGAPVKTVFENDEIDNLVVLGSAAQSYGDGTRSVRGAGPNAILKTSQGLSFDYDVVGNVKRMGSAANRYELGYDGRNQPVLIKRNGAIVGTYAYDESGVRVMKTSGGVTTTYAGPYHVSSHRTETFYPGIGVKVSVGGVNTLYFTVSDPRGSTSLMVDSSGAVTQVMEYQAYGKLRIESVAAGGYDNDQLFNGKEKEAAFDGSFDVFDFGPRFYLSDVGHWLSPDASFQDGPNRYAFVRGDPVNLADPTGRGAEAVAWLAWEILGPGPEDAVLWGVGALVSQADSPAPGPADVVAAEGIAVGTIGVRGVRIGQRVYRNWDKIRVVADGVIGSARRLRNNMDGIWNMRGLDAHHLAAKALPDFTTARWVLNQVGIHIDDARNGLPLPRSMHNWELHFSEDYVDDINDLLLNAYEKGRNPTEQLRYVQKALDDISQRILSGQYHIPLE